MSDREDYKIYVGNLAYDVTEREVRRHFEKYGDVDEGELLDRVFAASCMLGEKFLVFKHIPY